MSPTIQLDTWRKFEPTAIVHATAIARIATASRRSVASDSGRAGGPSLTRGRSGDGARGEGDTRSGEHDRRDRDLEE